MAETKYDRDTRRFNVVGLDLNRPIDSIKDGHFPYLKNARSYQFGRLEPRQGLSGIGGPVAAQTNSHSCRRLNDPLNSTYALIRGIGTHLATGTFGNTAIDSGYSGNPLALQPWRPESSPYSFMYIGDSARMRKISTTTLDTIGLAAPAAPPTANLSNSPLTKVVSDFDLNTDWVQGGDAAAPTNYVRVDTTVAQIIYDTGSTGWATVSPTSAAQMGPGARLCFDTGGADEEFTVIEELHPLSVATTIASVIYDSGTSGLCSIVLTDPIRQVEVNGMLFNSTLGEPVKIQAVITGPDNNLSVRVSTSGTWVAANAVQVLASFRCYLVNTHAAAEDIDSADVAASPGTGAITSAITFSTGIATLTDTISLDLSSYSTTQDIHPEDIVHISVRTDRPDRIIEIKVQADVNNGATDFVQNYYTKSFRPNDLTLAFRNQQSTTAALTGAIQTELVNTPTSPSTSTPVGGRLGIGPDSINTANTSAPVNPNTEPVDVGGRLGIGPNAVVGTTPSEATIQMSSGDEQWAEMFFPVSDWERVGPDQTRTLANVSAIRIVALVSGTINLYLDSWNIRGGWGPDISSSTAVPYLYRYRARNRLTNVPSNFSPATRGGINARRQSITVNLTQYTIPAGVAGINFGTYVLDIERFGGEIADWHYLATVENSVSPSFVDTLPDSTVGANPLLGNFNYQPWPTRGLAVTSTTGQVSGSTVNDSATSFNLSWAPGTRILINAVPFTIYRVLSTSRLELVENAGNQTAVTWRIDQPVILAQPLPCLWQWDNRFWACGDTVNPGRIYFSNPNSETTVEDNFYDITSPSEPLQNGLQFNVRGYVFSSESMIQLLQTGNADDPYRWEFIPNGKGMFSRWLLNRDPAPFMFFGSKDGIYVTTGGEPISLTDDTLLPLLPNEGNLGVTTNGISAPNYIGDQATNLRLAYYDSYLYFDYIGIDSNRATLALALDAGAISRGQAIGGWFWDVYSPGGIFHYGEEGSGVHSLLLGLSDGGLYQYLPGTDDNGSSFSFEFTTPSHDQGDPRSNKLYGDIMIDADTDGINCAITPFFNNNNSSTAAVTLNTSIRTITTIPLGSTWQTFRNISLNCIATIIDERRPLFYIYEPRWTFSSAPLAATSWQIDPTSFGIPAYKHIGLCRIAHVSTVDFRLIFTVDGITQPGITIPNSGGLYLQTVFRVPVMKGKLFSIRLESTSNAVDFRLDTRDTFIEVKPWNFDGENQKLRVFGDFAMVEG